jgi:hypothetical protein
MVQIGSVTAWRSGFVAVGAESFPVDNQLRSIAAVWRSDDGLHWSRIEPSDPAFTDGAMDAVVAFGGGLLALGTVGLYQDNVTPPVFVWRSSDGSHWQRQAGPSDLAGASISTLVERGSDLVAVGASNQSGTTVWVSTDAVHWAVTLSAGDSYSGLLNGADFVVIADHRASPTDPQDHPRLWVSSDARTWKETGDTGLPSGQSVAALGVGGGEYVLSGTAGSTSTLWASTDGLRWSQVQLDPNVFPPDTGSPTSALDFGVLVSAGTGVILLGGVPLHPNNSPAYQPMAWLWSPTAS